MNQLKTEIIALSNYADFSKDGKLSINGIFDEIYAEKFPSSFARGFLVFTVSGGDSNGKYPIKVEIKNSENKEILTKEMNVNTGNNGKGNFVAELVGMPLPTGGVYKVILQHKGKEIGSTTFTVSTPKNISETKKGKPVN